MNTSDRRPKLVPAFLISVGLVMIILAGGLREVRTVTSKTTETVSGRQVKVSTTEAPFVSDAMFVAAIALGGGLVLSGVFSRSISKIMLPGGAGFELRKRELWDEVAASAEQDAAKVGSALGPDRPTD